MPRETLDAYLAHGPAPSNRLDPRLETAKKTRGAFADVGISLEAHSQKLLADGVLAFSQSFDEMMSAIRERSAALA